jgi:hypothetical protein
MPRPFEPRSFRPREEIDPTVEVEVTFWTEILDCTPEELSEAVARVGNRAAAVATEFGVPLAAVSP